MKGRNAAWIAMVGVSAGITAGILNMLGILPLWLYAAVLVLSFPVFIIGLYLWWMAEGGTEDIPFIGY
jgi:threonine/homoserine/homoserine lactone efflux protein